jgi:hypothetical protein
MIRKLRTPPVDASLYEIREFLKGRNETGRLKTKAADDQFNELDTKLRSALKKTCDKDTTESVRVRVLEKIGFLL